MSRLSACFIFVLGVLLFHSPSGYAENGVQISSTWARTSNGPVGVVYANIYNPHDQDRSLVEVRVCGNVCDHAELHTHIHEGDIVKMRPVDKITLPAKATTRLEQGGFHVMLMGLLRPLVEGKTVPVTFVFDQGDPVKIRVPVQRLASFNNTGDNNRSECPCQKQ